MVVKLEVLDRQFDQLKGIISSASSQGKLTEAFDQAKALNTALVGKFAGEINNGIKALDAASSDFTGVDGSSRQALGLKNSTTVQQNLQHQLTNLQSSGAQLTGTLPGIGDKLAPPLASASKTAAAAITGTEVTESFTGIVFSAPTAAALGSVVKNMGEGIEAAEVGSIIQSAVGSFDINLKANLPTDLVSQLALPNINLNLGSITSKLDEFTGGITSAITQNLPTITDLPVLDALHQINRSTSIVAASFDFPVGLTGDLNPKNIAKGVLANMVNGTLDDAQNLVKSVIPGISDLDLSIKIEALNAEFGSIGAVLEDPLADIGIEQTNPINEVSSSGKYTIVNSIEEIKAEIQNSKREIKEGIWHWSETYANQIVTAEAIADINLGEDRYHYILRKNGSIQRGAPIDVEVSFYDTEYYSETAISILVVGGYPLEDDESGDMQMTSLTPEQIKTFDALFAAMIEVLPGIEMYSNAEIAENVISSSEPGINIETVAKTKYGKSREKVPEVVRTHAGNEEGKSIAKPGVTFSYRGAGVRNKDPQPQLVSILSAVAQSTGFSFEIFSAGQMPLDEWSSYSSGQKEKIGKKYFLNGKAVRIGSVRHDGGWAADVRVFTPSGQKIDWSVKSATSEMLTVITALKNQGITAFGAGAGYMIEGRESKYPGTGNLHIDIANGRNATTGATRWGAGGASTNAPPWLKNLVN